MAYSVPVVFVETPVFTRRVQEHLSDDDYAVLQSFLAERPDAGKIIKHSGGIRKLRWAGSGRGKRGGLRVIYYWWEQGEQFWLFTLYDKNETDDLTVRERSMLKALLEKEVAARRHS